MADKLVSIADISRKLGIAETSAGNLLKRHCQDLKQDGKWPLDACLKRISDSSDDRKRKRENRKDTLVDGYALTINQANTMLANIKVQQEQFKLDIMRGEYIPKNETKKEIRDNVSAIKNAILSIPDRISASLVGATEHDINMILNKELRLSLDSARNFIIGNEEIDIKDVC